MGLEVYYAPTTRATTVTLDELMRRLASAGLPNVREPDEDGMHWLVFAPHESTLLVSTQGGQVTFGTLELNDGADASFAQTIDTVMRGTGFSADEDAEYR